MTSGEFLPQMARLSAAYRKDISGATAEVYYEALGHLAPADLAAAVSWAIKTSKWLPPPSEILDRAAYERTARLRAIPAVTHEAIPEWVTEETGPADVPALIAELLPKLTLATKRVKALRPEHTPGAEVDLDQDARAARVAKAKAMLQAFHAHNAKEPA